MPSEMKRALPSLLRAALWFMAFAPAVFAQTAAPAPAKPFRIGWLSGGAGAAYVEFVNAFREGLREFGWTDGRHFVLVPRHAEGRLEKLDELAAELVSIKVDLIVATTPSALVAVQAATKTIPIVMVYGPDPAEAGMVTSLARPGGNVTGLTSLSVDLSVKQLELLRALAPAITRVAVLWNPANPWHPTAVQRVRAAMQVMGGHLVEVPVRTPDDLEVAFKTMASERVGALLSLSDPMTFSHRARLADLAVQHRLPSMHGVVAYTEAGGLASYWPNDVAMHRRAAAYVHRILGGGVKPADLPVEQPTRFELVINLKTAKRLGLQVPATVLARTDRTIE